MDAIFLLKGFVKHREYYYPTTTQQEFRVKVDNTLKPVFFSLFVRWGERNNRKLWKRLMDTSSIEKIEQTIITHDKPPGRLWVGNDLQPYYEI